MAPIDPLIVKVQNVSDFTHQARLQQEQLRVYKTLSKHRGLVKIINVETTPNHPHREGSEKDVDNLTSLFHQIGFTVDVYPFSQSNHTKENIKKCLEEFVEDKRLELADIAILFIMSHGNRTCEGRDYFDTVDGEVIFCDEVKNYFSNGWCKHMQNKPKIIFFETCRGNNLDKGYVSVSRELFQTNGTLLSSTKIPRVTDLLVAYATSPESVALRWPSVGSLFIHTLCNEFMRNAHKFDVVTMLSNIYWKMTQIKESLAEDRIFQAGEFNSKVFGHCFLNPGVYQDEKGVYKCLFTNKNIKNVVTTRNDTESMQVEITNNIKKLICCDSSENLIKMMKDINGKSILHIAAEHGHENCCERVIKAGVIVDAEDNNKYTPLHLASANNFAKCCKILLDAGAMTFTKSITGDSPLHLAALNGGLDVGKLLINGVTNVDAVNARGSTPLHLAASMGHTEFCTLLLNAKAKVEAIDINETTALHFAARHDQAECCIELIKFGASSEALTSDKQTALHDAASNGHWKTCKALHDAGVNIDQRSGMNSTPLQFAAERGHSKCLQVLIDLGADVNAIDCVGYIALHFAALRNHLECCKILKIKRANIFAINVDGDTAMHVAASKGHWKCVLFFKDSGMDIHMKNGYGKTPLNLAKDNGHTECINKINEHMQR